IHPPNANKIRNENERNAARRSGHIFGQSGRLRENVLRRAVQLYHEQERVEGGENTYSNPVKPRRTRARLGIREMPAEEYRRHQPVLGAHQDAGERHVQDVRSHQILIDALNFGSQMLNFSNLAVLSESSYNIHQCHEALLRMSYCSRCNGLPSTVKPCSGYCLNVMRGCLAQQAGELDSAWSSFYESVDRLMSVVNRGQSIVCLEDLLRSLDSRIHEPVQYFKQNKKCSFEGESTILTDNSVR
ncbi:Glypican, partial [Sarracenia purpurea var. burkii]